ncbi:YqzH family protein [Bacillus sp. REN3]|uniref:YqzH family protein n=1 Tax=Bacillus sp. REN3 TaxID=2802440 RepID=UPI001AEE455B|nr:YqzH family protein [Bacillus sp. REN3]
MDKKLIRKMVQKCLVQYRHDDDALPFSERDFEEIHGKIIDLKEREPEAELHEIINDVVYEFLVT